MGQGLFVICDDDEAYARKIYEYICERESESYDVFLFTGKKELEDFLSRKKVEILVISENLCEEGEEFINVKHTFVLRLKENYKRGSFPGVYKYKSGDVLLREIMNYCADSKEMHLKRSNSKLMKVIGIYSPVKRCFQTTFALTLGQILAMKGRALYLNFEFYSGFELINDITDQKDMSDLLYFLGCESDTFAFRLSSMTNRIGSLDYVSPAHSYISETSIRGDEWLKLIHSFKEYTDYEYLVLDLSENVCGLFDVLRECSMIYTITGNDRISSAKVGQYESLLTGYSYEDVIEKTRHIEVPVFREIPKEFEMLPYSELAGFVKGLVSEDFKKDDF